MRATESTGMSIERKGRLNDWLKGWRAFVMALATLLLCAGVDSQARAGVGGSGSTSQASASSQRKYKSSQRRTRRTRRRRATTKVVSRVPTTGIILGNRDVEDVGGDPNASLNATGTTPGGVAQDNSAGRSGSASGRTPIRGGVLNGRAISKPTPPYPVIARAARASGTVTVQIIVDESGRVISAQAISGHPLLQSAAVAAAREARFTPTLLSGQPVKVSGVITYNFVLQ